MDRRRPLVVIETHPVQYRAPVYRFLRQGLGIPVVAVYGSDFSVVGYWDREFQAQLAWDRDLLSGHESVFLSRVKQSSPLRIFKRAGSGLEGVLDRLGGIGAMLLVGYRDSLYQRAFLCAVRRRIPILFRAEVSDHVAPRGRLKSWLRDRALRMFYRKCFRMLTIGQMARRHFSRLGVGDEKMIFSPYCVDAGIFPQGDQALARCRQQARSALRISDRQTVLLFSGKLSRRKGVDLILPAVARMRPEARERIVVLFMGGGRMQGLLRDQARGFAEGKVRFVGFQNQTQMSPYYAAADILALPSRHSETWGLVVNEALWHGVPAVVSDRVGCGPDLVEPGRTGEICRADSAGDLSAAIERCLSWSGSPAVKERCRDKAQSYSVEKATEGIARAYREALGR